MASAQIISISIFLLLVGLFAFFLGSKKIRKNGPDYYAFFLMGIIWFPVGMATGNMGLWSLGLIFAIVGLVGRNKWNSRKIIYSKTNNAENLLKKILLVILSVAFVAGFLLYWLFRRGLI